MCLIARHLEAAGITTVILGSALDVVQHCGVPRFVFTDFPLGNPCGKPYDREMQRAVVEAGLALVESATGPRALVRSPYRWSEDETWRVRYLQVRPEDAEALAAKGEANRVQRRQLEAEGRVRQNP